MKTAALLAIAALVLNSSCMKKNEMPEPCRTNASCENEWSKPGYEPMKEKRPAQPESPELM